MDDRSQVKRQVFGGKSRLVLLGWDGGCAADANRRSVQEALADFNPRIGGSGQVVIHLAERALLLGLCLARFGLIREAVGGPDEASVSDLTSGGSLVGSQGCVVVLSEPCIRTNVELGLVIGASGAGPLPSHVL